jgi:hypothetical protein
VPLARREGEDRERRVRRPDGAAWHRAGEHADALYNIFGDAQWANKERLSNKLLRDLIEHFSRLSLSNKEAQADVLGQAYEYLIKHRFSVNDQSGDCWFFVEDPGCPDAVLEAVLSHCKLLRGERRKA